MKSRHLLQFFGAVIFLAFIGYYLFFLQTKVTSYSRYSQADYNKLPISDIPVINAGTKFFAAPLYSALNIKPGLTTRCPKQCHFIEASIFGTHKSKIDVTVLHARNLNEKGIDAMRYASEAGILGTKVIFSMECPLYTPIDTFNHDYALTYLSNSHGLSRPYNSFEEITNDTSAADLWTDNQVTSIIQAKTKGVLVLVSNCQTYSSREYLIEALSKLLPITIYGECAQTKCDSSCETQAVKDHYFYLAFENSVCNEYVTEKFWRMKELIVPIVLSRAVIGTTAPGDSFIAVDDFKSVHDLVKHLKFLMSNMDEYKKYFAWTKKYKKTCPDFNLDCALCNYAWDLRNASSSASTYLPTYDQWISQSHCQLNYALSLMTPEELGTTSYFPLYKKLAFLIIPAVILLFVIIYAYHTSKMFVGKIITYRFNNNNKG